MMQVTCSQCKMIMKKIDRPLEPGMDTFICSGCGIKKHFPKKSYAKLAREENIEKLDKERASTEGILPELETESRPLLKEKEVAKEEKITIFGRKEAVRADSKLNTKEGTSKISNLIKEIKLLSLQLNELKAKLEIKELEKEKLSKTFKGFVDDYAKLLDDLKTTFISKIKDIETLLSNLEKKLK